MSTMGRAVTWVGILAASWLYAAGASAQDQRFVLEVDGLACPFCAYGLERKLREVPGVREPRIDLESGTVSFEVERRRPVTPAALYAAVRDAGFTLRTMRMTATGTVSATGEGLVLELGRERLSLRGGQAFARARSSVASGPRRLVIRGEVKRRDERFELTVERVERPGAGR